MELVSCAGCRRHVRASEARCPFCESVVVPSRLGYFARAAIATTASVTLAACYGAPPRRDAEHPLPARTSWEHPTENAVGYVDAVERGARAAGCVVERQEPQYLAVHCDGQPDLRFTTLTGYVRIQCGDIERDVCRRARPPPREPAAEHVELGPADRHDQPAAVRAAVLAVALAGCGSLGTPREPIVAPTEHPSVPVVQLARARLPQPLYLLAVHYWFIAYDAKTGAWERWEVWQNASQVDTSWGHVHRDLMAPMSNVGGGDSSIERQWLGVDAQKLLDVLHRSPEYQYKDTYRAWPGPNSNTYVAWVLREADVGADLNPTAIGKDWRGWVGGGVTTTGTGLHFSTPLVGVKLGWFDGFEFQFLCLTFGFKWWRPALKTPFGALGFDEQ